MLMYSFKPRSQLNIQPRLWKRMLAIYSYKMCQHRYESEGFTFYRLSTYSIIESHHGPSLHGAFEKESLAISYSEENNLIFNDIQVLVEESFNVTNHHYEVYRDFLQETVLLS